jgi:hypothetical protein
MVQKERSRNNTHKLHGATTLKLLLLAPAVHPFAAMDAFKTTFWFNFGELRQRVLPRTWKLELES